MKYLPHVMWLVMMLTTATWPANSNAGFSVDYTLRGDYVISLHGPFKSPAPPFTGDALKLDAAIVGRYSFRASGEITGEHVLTFSNAAVPFGVVSRKEISGTWLVFPDGHLLLFLEEDSIDPITGPDGITDNTLVLECYVIERQRTARCIMHSLVTFQEGPDPIPLPATMSGLLERQH